MKKKVCERCFEEYDGAEIYISNYYSQLLFCTPCEREYENKLINFRIGFLNEKMTSLNQNNINDIEV